MATSPGLLKATAVKEMSKFPVLPPIEGTQQRDEVAQATAAKDEIAQRIRVQKKLLLHRRSKVQQQQLHEILYMNYMFLKRCVESSPGVPIQQHCIDSIVARVPHKLQETHKSKTLLQELCKEVSNDFHNVIVRHTGIAVLLFECEQCLIPYSPPSVDTVLKNPQKEGPNSEALMQKNLHVLHPVMQTILDIGYVTFSSLILVDLAECRASGPVDCKGLQNKMAVQCKRTEDRIMNTWFPKVISLLTSKETLRRVKEENQDSFFRCASTLISNQLKSVLHKSVEEFVGLFDPSNGQRLLIFRMALTFDDEKMEIYPTLQDLKAAVFEILYAITNTLQKVQTIQSWLVQGASIFVDAKVADHILSWAKVTVKSTLCKNLEEPDKHFQNYEEHSFEEYTKQVEEFRSLSKEISSLPAKAHFTMVHLDCEELKQGLANKAKNYAEILLKKLIISHREQNLQICSEFETISEKAVKIPETTEEMTELIGYIHLIKTSGIAQLNEKIKEAYCRLTYLLHVHTIEPEDQELNSTLFLWPQKILHAFELHDEVLQKAKKKGEQELIARRERLIVQLEKLGRRIEEFPLCSELDMMQQYIKDVKTVQKLLQEAEETIVFINKQEDFYKWEQTCYPEVDVIRDSIEPYHKVFGLVLKWQRTENRWMDGSFQDLDGESMEGKVDDFLRETFKMLKFFQQKQNKTEQEMEKMAGATKRRASVDSPRKQESPTVFLCSTVMEQIKEFKVVYVV
uniref:Dynein heavy chain linker domain-containing protein n=1 Tax=Labrus bergylta TaxID=56723 RepID=A0A3Q3F6B1_9LABR